MKVQRELCAFLRRASIRESIVVAFAARTSYWRSELSRKSNRNTSTRRSSSTKANKPPDDFVSIARRLGCDEDKGRFEFVLGKIARSRTPTMRQRGREHVSWKASKVKEDQGSSEAYDRKVAARAALKSARATTAQESERKLDQTGTAQCGNAWE